MKYKFHFTWLWHFTGISSLWSLFALLLEFSSPQSRLCVASEMKTKYLFFVEVNLLFPLVFSFSVDRCHHYQSCRSVSPSWRGQTDMSRGRCGSAPALQAPYVCACDGHCKYFNDCCQDFSSAYQPQVGTETCAALCQTFRLSLHFTETAWTTSSVLVRSQ